MISVIIPARNEADRLGGQLDALVAQVDAPVFEVIVVDDGSTDETVAVAHAYRDRLDLRVVPGPGEGCGPARDAGVEVAAFDRLLFCDADDLVSDNWVAALGADLDQVPFTTCRRDVRQVNPPWAIAARRLRKAAATFDEDRPVTPIGASAGLRRETLEALGGWGPVPGEDVSLVMRAEAAGVTIGCARAAHVHYRLRTDLRSLYRQQFQYGIGQQRVRVELGRPRPSLRRLRALGWLVRHLHWAVSPRLEHRGRFLRELAWVHGRFVGGLRYRTWPW